MKYKIVGLRHAQKAWDRGLRVEVDGDIPQHDSPIMMSRPVVDCLSYRVPVLSKERSEDLELEALRRGREQSKLLERLPLPPEVERTLSRLVEWSMTFGAALNPTAADTYGEGVRACKAQVAEMLRGLTVKP